MKKVRLIITESKCRAGYHLRGQEFLVGDINPPICSELWNNIYPYVLALRSGGRLDSGETKALSFSASCPDGGRVKITGELIEEE